MNFFKLLRQSPWSARIGMVMVLINIVAAILAPVICPYSETEVVGDVWLTPNKDNLLGTDHLGRDMFTRLVYGARNTIAIAFVTTMLSFVVGIHHGIFCGHLGRMDRSGHQPDCRYPDGLSHPDLCLDGAFGGGNRNHGPDRGDRPSGLHPCLSSVAGGGHGYRGHGIRRSGPVCAANASGGSCGTRFCPMPCRPWWPSSVCASVSYFCSSPP